MGTVGTTSGLPSHRVAPACSSWLRWTRISYCNSGSGLGHLPTHRERKVGCLMGPIRAVTCVKEQLLRTRSGLPPPSSGEGGVFAEQTPTSHLRLFPPEADSDRGVEVKSFIWKEASLYREAGSGTGEEGSHLGHKDEWVSPPASAADTHWGPCTTSLGVVPMEGQESWGVHAPQWHLHSR